jgi:hypothetical protein
MKTIRKTEGTTTSFIMADLDPAYHDAVRALYYSPVEEGFAESPLCRRDGSSPRIETLG